MTQIPEGKAPAKTSTVLPSVAVKEVTGNNIPSTPMPSKVVTRIFKQGDRVKVIFNIPGNIIKPKYPYSTGIGTVKSAGIKKSLISFPGTKQLFTFDNEVLQKI